MQRIKILGSGKYLPKNKIDSEEIDRKIGAPRGWAQQKSGVLFRHFVKDETASEMAKIAVLDAIHEAGINLKDIDCIIGASGSMEQPIPCNAALIQKALDLGDSGIACFDINTTCLSFVVALDMASYLIEAGRYKCIAIVSSEIASVGLNWGQNESSVLFGDGAAAFIIGKTTQGENSHVMAAKLHTYANGAHLSEIRGGGNKYHPREHSEHTKNEFLFDMNGQAIFKMTSKLISGFLDELLSQANLNLEEIAMVVPHQASHAAMALVRKRLGISEDKFMNIIEHHGNVIAASIPMALHEAIKQQRIKRGDKVMLLGTSAGLSIGGVIFEY